MSTHPESPHPAPTTQSDTTGAPTDTTGAPKNELFRAEDSAPGFFGLIMRATQIALYSLYYFCRYLGKWIWIRLRTPVENRESELAHAKGWCLRNFFQSLSATFIKIGQILSSRPDIFPPEIIDELALLQDKVPPFDSKHIDGIFEEDFGKSPDELFATFNRTSIASASVAQVHEATLPTGEKLAVKILRPNIRAHAISDLKLMSIGATLLEKLPSMRWVTPTGMVNEFANSIAGQLDLRREAENNRRFIENFKDVEGIDFPYVYSEYSSEHVLTMEFAEGKKVADIDHDNLNTSKIAELGILMVGQMTFNHGFIHCDLHPGNILFTSEGNTWILDVGMVAELDEYWQERMARIMYCRVTNNGKGMAKTFFEMAEYNEETDYPAFEKDIVEILDEQFEQTMDETEFSEIFAGLLTLIRTHRLKLSMVWIMTMMAAITGEGVAKRLDPDIQLEQVLLPMLQERFAGKNI